MAAFSYLLNGVEYNLSDNTLCTVVDTGGIEAPAWDHYSERGPGQPGATSRGTLLTARLVRLVVRLTGSASSVETKRRSLRRLFAPSASGTLKRTSPGALVRLLDVVPLAVNRLVHSAAHEEYEVQLWAGTPTWYAVSATTTVLLASASDELAIPMVVPWEIGPSALADSTTIQYAGEVDEYPMLTITGPATRLSVANTTPDTTLLFDKPIEPGEVLTVDCRYGRKTVTNAAGTNRIALLATGQHDLATFRLLHNMASLLDDGYTANEIAVEAEGIDNNTAVSITYYTRELGV